MVLAGAALQFSLAPSVLGVSWVENAMIPLIFSLGVGGAIHPAATPSVSALAHINTIPDSSSDTQLDSKEDCYLGLDMLYQFEAKIM